MKEGNDTLYREDGSALTKTQGGGEDKEMEDGGATRARGTTKTAGAEGEAEGAGLGSPEIGSRRPQNLQVGV